MPELDQLASYIRTARIVSELTFDQHGAHQSYLLVLEGGVGVLAKPEDEINLGDVLVRREVAGWLVACMLGWPDLVAATVLRTIRSFKTGVQVAASLQVLWPFPERIPPPALSQMRTSGRRRPSTPSCDTTIDAITTGSRSRGPTPAPSHMSGWSTTGTRSTRVWHRLLRTSTWPGKGNRCRRSLRQLSRPFTTPSLRISRGCCRILSWSVSESGPTTCSASWRSRSRNTPCVG
jgi:hypothetical protein